jgi:acylphosphatase
LTTRRYLISGLVQGVGYRRFVQQEGRRLGLRGWVRNHPNGTVVALAVGQVSQLEAFGVSLAIGHPHANVTKVETKEISDELDGPSNFTIRSSSH